MRCKRENRDYFINMQLAQQIFFCFGEREKITIHCFNHCCFVSFFPVFVPLLHVYNHFFAMLSRFLSLQMYKACCFSSCIRRASILYVLGERGSFVA